MSLSGGVPPRMVDTPSIDGMDGFTLLLVDELGSFWSARDQTTGTPLTVRVARVEHATARVHGAAPFVNAGVTAAGEHWVAHAGVLQPLAVRLRESPLSAEETLDLLRDVTNALAALHVAGQVHGGIAPVSVLAGPDGWLLTDVGLLARAAPLPPAPASRADASLARVAPEVLRGGSLEAASDVFAVGLLVAEAVTGRAVVVPAPDDSVESIAALLEQGLPDVPELRALPVPVLEAIRRAVEPAAERISLDELRRVVSSVGEVDRRDAVFDDDVRFTVYRPNAVAPSVWSSLIAFAHKTEASDDADHPDPLAEVEQQARAVLGASFGKHQAVASDADQSIFRGAELRFVPEVDGVEFNPPSAVFRWVEAVHRQEFRFRAAPHLDGTRARGQLTVYLGTLIIGEVTLSFRVDSAAAAADTAPVAAETARVYSKVFASYSHRDLALVEHVEALVQVVDNEYLRDWTHLRSGEVWNDELEAMIREADIFQLFWSSASMDSDFVRQEWVYALSLGRGERFVRPVYWEDPMPARPADNLPPPELSRLHFAKLDFGLAPTPSPPPPAAMAPAAAPPAAPPPGAKAPSSAPPPSSRAPGRKGIVGAVVGAAAIAATGLLLTVSTPGGGGTAATQPLPSTTAHSSSTAAEPSVIDAASDVAVVCVSGAPSTAHVAALVRGVPADGQVWVASDQNVESRLILDPSGFDAATGLSASRSEQLYTGELGPYESPGVVRWFIGIFEGDPVGSAVAERAVGSIDVLAEC